MNLLHMKKVHEGNYLHNYELTFQNNAGREKTFELVSRNPLSSPQELGQKPSGITLIAWQDQKLLLLREFRMSINKPIFNLCAGMLEEGESAEDCARRELLEETGLRIAKIHAVFPPSYSAVGFSDTSTYLVFAETSGIINSCPSENEEISAGLYTAAELEEMLQTEEFSSMAQMAACFMSNIWK